MKGLKTTLTMAIAVGLLAGSAVGVAAQDEDTAAEGAVVDVTGVEYAYQNLPTSIPAGTTLTFSNDGVEFHEMAISRVAGVALERGIWP